MNAHQKNQSKPNRLHGQASPYLLQHAWNPVDWYPWSDEAFAKARAENKPIFLSIGYSTCHWCHVMAHESFEDPNTAAVMNEHFVSVKIDREQRPDIDAIYMQAVQAMTGSGGWPLSVFLTPEGRPFYGGTYFPPTERMGLPGFKQLLLAVADAWETRKDELTESAEKITILLSGRDTSPSKINPDVLDKARGRLGGMFDQNQGGFGTAPKFPQPSFLELLLVHYFRTGDAESLQMVIMTLDAMAHGGIYDQLGGGFHRYATDAAWRVPHFEKMLYDQALIAAAYLNAWKITQNDIYARIVRETLEYVLRDMTDASGGFYAAEDADSEGQEGRFYVWTPAEVETILDKNAAAVFNEYYGVTAGGNFERNTSILHVSGDIDSLARKFDKTPVEIGTLLAGARLRLFDRRTQRVRPHRDEKIITAWNGMMIQTLARAGFAFNEPKYTEAARTAARFVLDRLYIAGRLRRFFIQGSSHDDAVLEDYAFFILGLLDLYQADFDPEWIRSARRLGDEMVELFYDPNAGGFYQSGRDTEALFLRHKPDYDGAVPSGNSAAALALLRLGRITMDTDLTEKARSTLTAFAAQFNGSPLTLSCMLLSVDGIINPSQEIVIAEGTHPGRNQAFLDTLRKHYLPSAVFLLRRADFEQSGHRDLLPHIEFQSAIENKAAGYICENYACRQPLTDPDAFDRALRELAADSKKDINHD